MKRNNTHDNGYWTKDRCREEAKKYKTKSAFRKGCQGAYGAAWSQLAGDR